MRYDNAVIDGSKISKEDLIQELLKREEVLSREVRDSESFGLIIEKGDLERWDHYQFKEYEKGPAKIIIVLEAVNEYL